MRKITALILFIGLNFHLSAQKKFDIFFDDFVECYYSEKEHNSIVIYEVPNGEIIAELKPLNTPYCWYKFAISESSNGWLKIENIIILPNCVNNKLNENIEIYKGKWVLANNMKINISDINNNPEIGVKFYKNPDNNSEIIYQSGVFLQTELKEINGLWAKVTFIIDSNEITGWLERKNQCAYPWTTCPYRD